ncbi:MAG: protein O-mannosyl-transferase family [Chitinophagaceae bacterium]
MSFKRTNNITGWLVFFVAFVTYFLTREARGSLWDTGEFIACAKNLGLPHPPGAPMFVLLGRFFIILFGENNAGSAVNFMSALASAATILFLFWSVTHFARKMFVGVGEDLSSSQLYTTMAAGVVGALAYTFSDSFWFSAVEGEVYALSSFFTALVFWAMLKWEHADEHAGGDPHARLRSDRWIIFLFFMMGLSIGVHLLNLLVIPAIVMIYYYRRYQPTTKGAIWAFVLGCLITGIVQVGVIQFSMKAAGQFDVFFVNSLGMPFFSGFAFYFIAIAALIIWALRFDERKISHTKLIIWFVLFLSLSALPFIIKPGSGLQFLQFILLAGIAAAMGYFLKPAALKILKLSLWCYAFMMIGYFMYFTALIRSNANPGIDMNNVDNPINLVYYLSREQYGEAPLVYGPHFAADYKPDPESPNGVSMQKGDMKYVRGDKKYIPIGTSDKPRYESEDMQIFPRVWDPSNDQYHADFYADWLNLQRDEQTGRYEAPTYADNFNWFFSYQMSLMYWRYFMWNFSGKQNDIQGLGNKRDGNWITGISFIDNKRLGDQSKLPDSIKKNKAVNKLYLLPFLLGIVGCVYQFLRNRKDWIVNFLLFFMTGIAIVFYLNQPGNQPRERDYAYVGSFYAFAIWIGLAVVAFVRMAREKSDQLTFQNMLLFGGVLTFVVTLMSCVNDTGGAALLVPVIVTALYAAVTAGVTYLVRAVSSGGQQQMVLNVATTLVCMAAPLIMAQQEWDDHDRSHKTTAPDMARDYLESCAPNAIIFTFGDNDTYPLWYAQEVEGVRPDIRVINNSLLGIDWYINQLRYKINDADSVNVLWSPEQIEGHNREYLRYRAQGDPNVYYDLYDVMKNVLGKPNVNPETGRDEGYGSFPVAKFRVPVDTALVRKNGTVNANDSVLSEIKFEIPKDKLDGGLVRSDFIILNIIATNQWKRPIYFTSPFGELGFAPYLRKDGLAYRLIPVYSSGTQENWLVHRTLREVGLGGTSVRDNNQAVIFENLYTKYRFGGADRKGIYFDEENRRHLLNLRALYGEAAGNLADAGRMDEAKKLLEKVETGILPENMPYAMVSRYGSHNQQNLLFLEACYKAGKPELAEKVRQSLRKDMEQQKAYYIAMNGGNTPNISQMGSETNEPNFQGLMLEYRINEAMMIVLDEVEKKYAPEKQVKKPAVENPAPTINNTVKPDSAAQPDTSSAQ